MLACQDAIFHSVTARPCLMLWPEPVGVSECRCLVAQNDIYTMPPRDVDWKVSIWQLTLQESDNNKQEDAFTIGLVGLAPAIVLLEARRVHSCGSLLAASQRNNRTSCTKQITIAPLLKYAYQNRPDKKRHESKSMSGDIQDTYIILYYWYVIIT